MMNEQTVRQVVTARFYESLAQSGVEVSAIPQPQLQAIVNALADGVFAALDAMETEADHTIAETDSRSGDPEEPRATSPALEPMAAIADHLDKEELLWSGRPYLSIGVRYELTTQRVRLIRGLLGRSYHEIELVRVRDTSVNQHLGERALNVGDVTITSNDPSHPEFTLNNVKDPMEVREMIRQATMKEKQRRGLHFREEM
ncbi:MAG: PH domain-containing protein [Caldilineaceae bacterium]|nr:PH domain-containing protein [Caldilineaceae bacterium]